MTDCPHFRTALELREGARPLGPEARIDSVRNALNGTVALFDRDGDGERYLEIDSEWVQPVGAPGVLEQR
jgi:hypothetical protein